MPKTIRIDYPDNYLFISNEDLKKYAIDQIVKVTYPDGISIGDKIQIGRPLYCKRRKIIDKLFGLPLLLSALLLLFSFPFADRRAYC